MRSVGMANDWLNSEMFKCVATDVLRMLRNFMGDKSFFITHINQKHVRILATDSYDIDVKNGDCFSLAEMFHLEHLQYEKYKIVVVNDILNDERTPRNGFLSKFHQGAYLGVPILLNDGSFFGTFAVFDRNPYEFTPKDIDNVQILSRLISVSIENQLLLCTDHLTKLYNRSYLEQLMEQIEESEEVSTMVLFDIDNFKNINDQYGHMVGDKALKSIGEVIKKLLPLDVIGFRFGGDEFGLFIPSKTAEECVSFIKTMMEKVNNYHETFNVTLSIGISDTLIADCYTLLDTADIALYQSKEKGKNQFTIYQSQ